jgi:hypothetical protein
LIFASNRCLPEEERIALTFDALNRIPQRERDGCWVKIAVLCEGLGSERGFSVCVEYLDGLSKRDIAASAAALLSRFKSEHVLDWIETHVFDFAKADSTEMAPIPGREIVTTPRFTDWGQLASVSRLTWKRVSDWLARGNPLSRVALDALISCGKLRSEFIRGHILQTKSPLLHPVSVEVMTLQLQQYARSVGTPEVTASVELIVQNWPKILAGHPPEE